MKKNTIDIERATVYDSRLLSYMSMATFIEAYENACSNEDLVQFMNKCFSEKVIAEELEQDDFYFIVIAFGNYVGYMRLKEDYTDLPSMRKYKALQLKRIYVLEKYQSKKVGTALMNYALQLAAEKNYEVLWLGVWEENKKAISFYEKFGFIDTGENALFHIGSTVQTDNWMMKFIQGKEHTEDTSL